MRATLVVAAVYNIVFGLWTIVAPSESLGWLGIADTSTREQVIWQSIDMVVGVYGIAYMSASRNPVQHWPVVLAGLLGNVFGPIGFCISAARGVMPWRMGTIIVFNELIWWIPFAAILFAAHNHWQAQRNQHDDRLDHK